jgi:hypothetical protein
MAGQLRPLNLLMAMVAISNSLIVASSIPT